MYIHFFLRSKQIVFLVVMLGCFFKNGLYSQGLSLPPLPKIGKFDTIPHAITLHEDEWVLYASLPEILLVSKMSLDQYREWAKLERAVNKVFPYAKEMGKKILEMRQAMNQLPNEKERKNYLKSQEETLLATFTPAMKKMSRFQGRVLIKLINRESGNSCYELLKDYKGGFIAGVWETFTNFFGNSLKESYNPDEVLQDRIIEEMMLKLENEKIY